MTPPKNSNQSSLDMLVSVWRSIDPDANAKINNLIKEQLFGLKKVSAKQSVPNPVIADIAATLAEEGNKLFDIFFPGMRNSATKTEPTQQTPKVAEQPENTVRNDMSSRDLWTEIVKKQKVDNGPLQEEVDRIRTAGERIASERAAEKAAEKAASHNPTISRFFVGRPLPWHKDKNAGTFLYDNDEQVLGTFTSPELAQAVVDTVNLHGKSNTNAHSAEQGALVQVDPSKQWREGYTNAVDWLFTQIQKDPDNAKLIINLWQNMLDNMANLEE